MLITQKNGGKMMNSSREINNFCDIEYLNDKSQLHREDGPAVIYTDGSQRWYKNGKIHREDGPAKIYSNGAQVWYKNGELHRKDGPAIFYDDGRKEWWENDKFIKKS